MPQPNFNQISYTYLHTLACPYQAFLRYEGRLKTRMTHYLAIGNALHYVLEKAYQKDGDAYILTMGVDDAVKLYLSDFKRQIDEDEVFVTYPQLKKAQADGAEMLVRYYDQVKRGLIDPRPVGIEQAFKLPLEGINIVGKIDKTEKSKDGLVVIDYKSGGRKPLDWMLRRDLQFSTYAWACQEIYGEFPAKVVWHHLRTGERLESTREDWDIDNLKRIVSAAVFMQTNDVRYRVYHDKVCGQCDYHGEGRECDDKELEQTILNRRSLTVIQ